MLAPLLFLVPVSSQLSAPQEIFGTPQYPTDIATGDLDGDGDLDALITSRDDNSLRWVENLGARQFAAPEVVSADLTGARTVVAFDFDSDGDVDVITGGEYSDRIELHENQGDGSLAAPALIEAQVDRVWRLKAIDMDADGDLDLFAVVAGSNRITWLENLGGAFAPSAPLLDGVIDVRDASLGDFNGDGLADILTASPSSNQFVWAPGLGGMTFGAPRIIALETGAYAVAAADVDGNGTVDVVTGSRDARLVTVYSNGGGAAPTFTPVYSRTSGEVLDVTVFDVDGDGALDVAWTSGFAIAYVRQTGPLGFGPPEGASFINDGPLGRLHLADMDGDGLTDVLGAAVTSTSPSGGNGDVVRVTWNEAGQGLGDTQRLFQEEDTTWWLEGLDLNQDGDLDLVSLQSDRSFFGPLRITIFRASQDGEFTREDGAFLGRVNDLQVGDFDADGDQDVLYSEEPGGGASTTSWLEQRSDGSLGSPQLLFAPASGEAPQFSLADVDGDGDQDILSRSDTFLMTETYWRENLGAGQLAARQALFQSPRGFQLLAEDLNGDGAVEILLDDDQTLRLYMNDGMGGFGAPTTLLSGGEPIRALTLDADGDGDLDVAVEVELSSSAFRWTTCLFEGGTLQSTIQSPIHSSRTSRAAAVDWNGDGTADIVGSWLAFSSPRGRMRLFEGTGSGSFLAETALFESEVTPWFLEVGDVDGDADADIVIADRTLIMWLENERSVGNQLCPGELNSTGRSAMLEATGSDVTTSQSVVLTARDLPVASSVLFFNSMQTGFLANPSGSQGNVCLGDPIGRHVGPGEVQTSSAAGTARLGLDLGAMPTPFGPTSVMSGQTWHFQAWYRDANPQVTTNFTSAVSILFQ